MSERTITSVDQGLVTTGATAGWLVDQLPVAMAEDEFTRRFVGIFETIADSVRSRLDGLEHVLSPGLAPPATARWLGSWLGLAIPSSLPEERQRALVAAFGPLLTWRGTARGLGQLLEAYTGAPAEVADSGGVARAGAGAGGSSGGRRAGSSAGGSTGGRHSGGPRRVVVRLASAGGLSSDDLDTLIRRELPPGSDVEIHVGEAER